MTKYAMNLVGKEMLGHMNARDRAGLFVPVSFEDNGKELSGAILTLGDRAIFAWITGTLRIKNYETVVPYASITHVESAIRAASRMSVEREILSVHADRHWTVLHSNIFEGGRPVAVFLERMLNGSGAVEHNEDGTISAFSIDLEHPNAP